MKRASVLLEASVREATQATARPNIMNSFVPVPFMLAVLLAACGGGLGEPSSGTHAPAADSIVVSPGVTPTFTWRGRNIMALHVSPSGGGDGVWGIIAQDTVAGLSGPITLGVTPAGATTLYRNATVLTKGQLYAVGVFFVNRKEFSKYNTALTYFTP